jgi:hypothetical protein
MSVSPFSCSGLLVLVGVWSFGLNATADEDEPIPAKPYYTSQAEADARFEQELEKLDHSGRALQPIDPKFLPPASPKHQQNVASIKKKWDKNFKNAKNVIGLREKPPPPPNGQFKKAENGGLLKHVDKTRNGRKKGSKGKGKGKKKRGKR